MSHPLPTLLMMRVEVFLDEDAASAALRDELVRGLTATHKTLSPTWFYDDRGCELYDDITKLPESSGSAMGGADATRKRASRLPSATLIAIPRLAFSQLALPSKANAPLPLVSVPDNARSVT